MRLALLTDESLPKGTRAHAQMIHQLAAEFEKNGHKSVVITPGNPHQETALIIDFVDGIEYWRFKSGYTREVGNIRRLINEWLLSYRAWSAIADKVVNCKFDLCINYSPTIFFGPLTRKFKRQGTFVYLILRDMFPQWIINIGLISERSPAAFFLRYYESLNYRMADCIGVMSHANLEVFNKAHPSLTKTNVKILMNWSSTAPFALSKVKFDIRQKYELSEKIVFFYGGSLTTSNDMPNIMRLAKNLIEYKNVHFLILGQGDQFDLINELAELWNLNNVTILPSVSQMEYKMILTQVDVGLFSLSIKYTDHNFPGKLLGYMVESIPILGSANVGNDLMGLINDSNAGFVHVNGDDKALANSAIKLIEGQDKRLDCGINARSLLEQYFSVEAAYAHILLESNLSD